MAQPHQESGKLFFRPLTSTQNGNSGTVSKQCTCSKTVQQNKTGEPRIQRWKILSSPSELWPVVTRLSVSESLFLFPPAAGPLPQSSSANRGIRHKCSMP